MLLAPHSSEYRYHVSHCADLFFAVSMYHIPSYHSKLTASCMGNLFKATICTILLTLLAVYVIFFSCW
jgi:hypothetical protein